MSKIRQGFVSNSSSTSFYINGNKFTQDKVELAVIILLELDANINSLGSPLSIEDVCYISTKSKENLQSELGVTSKYYGRGIIDRLNEFPKDVIVVDSCGSNSISWEIQEYLEQKFNALRQHWG
jgi:hypothetical protein